MECPLGEIGKDRKGEETLTEVVVGYTRLKEGDVVRELSLSQLSARSLSK